jgi:hypothetical protein
MTMAATETIKISEQELNGTKIYHWSILDSDGDEVSHSSYHLDRAKCEQEAVERLAQYQEMVGE